jgi:hypothetical protein
MTDLNKKETIEKLFQHISTVNENVLNKGNFENNISTNKQNRRT